MLDYVIKVNLTGLESWYKEEGNDFANFDQIPYFKEGFSELNSSLGSTLEHMVKFFDHTNNVYYRENVGKRNRLVSFDLDRETDWFKLLAKCIEYLPIDRALCKETKMIIWNVFNDFIEDFERWSIIKTEEASEQIEMSIKNLNLLFDYEPKFKKYQEEEVVSAIKANAKSILSPVLEEMKSLELSTIQSNESHSCDQPANGAQEDQIEGLSGGSIPIVQLCEPEQVPSERKEVKEDKEDTETSKKTSKRRSRNPLVAIRNLFRRCFRRN